MYRTEIEFKQYSYLSSFHILILKTTENRNIDRRENFATEKNGGEEIEHRTKFLPLVTLTVQCHERLTWIERFLDAHPPRDQPTNRIILKKIVARWFTIKILYRTLSINHIENFADKTITRTPTEHLFSRIYLSFSVVSLKVSFSPLP